MHFTQYPYIFKMHYQQNKSLQYVSCRCPLGTVQVDLLK
jgi:hypothetical protein